MYPEHGFPISGLEGAAGGEEEAVDNSVSPTVMGIQISWGFLNMWTLIHKPGLAWVGWTSSQAMLMWAVPPSHFAQQERSWACG